MIGGGQSAFSDGGQSAVCGGGQSAFWETADRRKAGSPPFLKRAQKVGIAPLTPAHRHAARSVSRRQARAITINGVSGRLGRYQGELRCPPASREGSPPGRPSGLAASRGHPPADTR